MRKRYSSYGRSSKHVLSFLCLIVILCFGTADATNWKCSNSELNTYNVDDYTTVFHSDMKRLGVGQECIIRIESSFTYRPLILLEVKREESTLLESCGTSSNTLTLVDGGGRNTSLMCGNEMAVGKISVQRLATLVFTKKSTFSKLLLFDIEATSFYVRPYSLKTVLTVSDEPRVLQSLSDTLETDVPLMLKSEDAKKAIVIKLRYEDQMAVCASQMVNREVVRYCSEEMMSAVFVNGNVNKVTLYSYRSYANGGGEFEFEFRSIKQESFMQEDYDGQAKTIKVDDALYMPIALHKIKEGGVLEIVLVAGNPKNILQLTNIIHKSMSQFEITFLVGENSTLTHDKDKSVDVGLLRGRPGDSITIKIKRNTAKLISLMELGVIVETIDADNLPVAIYRPYRPSYVWVPSADNENESRDFELRSAIHFCTEILILRNDFSSSHESVADFVSVYTGEDGRQGFELTKNCLYEKNSDTSIYNNASRITYIAPKQQASSHNGEPSEQSGFWIRFSKENYCPMISTYLRPPQAKVFLINIFDRLNLKKFMNCLFVITTSNLGIQFKGSLNKLNGAKLYVLESEEASHRSRLLNMWSTSGRVSQHVLTDFAMHSSSKWFYSQRHIYVIFQTQATITSFMASFDYGAHYRSTSDSSTLSACPGPADIVVDSTDIIQRTPEYPNHLMSNVSCTWIFRRPLNNNGRLHIETEELSRLFCPSSSSELFITGMDNPNERKSVCETHSQVFHDSAVKFEFEGGENYVMEGFIIHPTVKPLEYAGSCNKTYYLSSKSYEITANFRPGQFLVPLYCEMKFQATDRERRLEVTVKNVDLQPYTLCNENSLSIFDGLQSNDPLLGKLCDLDHEFKVKSFSHNVLVVISIQQQLQKNLNLKFSVNEDSSCSDGEILYATSRHQELKSPGYPVEYESNMACSWRIETASYATGLEIQFQEFSLEKCNYDYLMIFDGNNMDAAIATLCGNVSGKPKYRSRTGTFVLKFKSDAYKNYPGFRLKYYVQEKPSPDLVNGDDFETHGKSKSKNMTGVIIGICLAVIVGVFGITVIIGWVVYKKRQRNSQIQRRSRQAAPYSLQFNNSSQDSVFVINPVIMNNAAPPPPYPGHTNEGFSDDLPPSYDDSFQYQTNQASSTPAYSNMPPPPPYTAAPGNLEGPQRQENEEPAYDIPTQENESNHQPIYQTLTDTAVESTAHINTNVPANVYGLMSRQRSNFQHTPGNDQQEDSTGHDRPPEQTASPPTDDNDNSSGYYELEDGGHDTSSPPLDNANPDYKLAEEVNTRTSGAHHNPPSGSLSEGSGTTNGYRDDNTSQPPAYDKPSPPDYQDASSNSGYDTVYSLAQPLTDNDSRRGQHNESLNRNRRHNMNLGSL